MSWRGLFRLGPLDQLARAMLTLGLAGGSLVLCLQTVFLKRPEDFLMQNQLGNVKGRTMLLVTAALGALLPNLLAFGYLVWARARNREGALDRVRALATRVAPLTLVFIVPALFIWRIGYHFPLLYLSALGLFALGQHRLVARSFESLAEQRSPLWVRLGDVRVSPRICMAVVVVAVIAFSIYISFYTIRMHRLINTTAFDLGIYDNLMFNAMKGRPFSSPVLFGLQDKSYIAGHAEFAMLLFVPFYALRPGPETMLVIQTVVVGASAIPLYLFARTRLPSTVAMVLALCFLFYAPTQLPLFYDFHWLPLVIFFLFWVFYGVATGRHWITLPAVVVVWLIREDTAVGVAFFGLYLLVTGWRPRLGFVLALVSSIWFVIVRFGIMPRAGTWFFQNHYNRLFAEGQSSFASVIRTLVSNPIYVLGTLLTKEKVTFILHMLASLAFLPVRRPIYVLLLIPGAIFTILTTDSDPMTTIRFQYTSHTIPYTFFTTVLALGGLATLGRPRLYAATAVLVFCVVSHSYNYGAILQHEQVIGGFRQVQFKMPPEAQKRYQALRELVDKIPPEASVAGTEYMNPHVSTRVTSYVLRYEVDGVDYVLISAKEINDTYRGYLTNLFSKTPYGLVGYTGNEFYLFKKGLESPTTAEALNRLAIVIPPK